MMATQPKERTPLTTAEAAKALGDLWTAATLRSWRSRDMGPPYYKPTGPRGKTVYYKEEVLAWREANHVEPCR